MGFVPSLRAWVLEDLLKLKSQALEEVWIVLHNDVMGKVLVTPWLSIKLIMIIPIQ